MHPYRMEYSTHFSFYLLLIFSLPLLTFLLLRLHSYRLRRHLRIPPGTLGLPFLGETLQVMSAFKSSNPDTFIDDRVSRLGSPVFTSHVFGEPTVFSADHETNRFILMNEGKLFESSYPGSVSNLLGRHSLLVMKGGLHKRLHALTTSMTNSSSIRDHLMADIERWWSQHIESDVKCGGDVALNDDAKNQLSSNFVILLFKIGFDCDYPPFVNFVLMIWKARGKVAEALRMVVRERRRRENERGERKKKDMLGALLDEEGSGDGLSEEEIVDFLVSILVAGYDTTSTIMTLAVKFLTETPLALAQLKEEQDEIRSRKGKSEALQWNDYKSMSFTECVSDYPPPYLPPNLPPPPSTIRLPPPPHQTKPPEENNPRHHWPPPEEHPIHRNNPDLMWGFDQTVRRLPSRPAAELGGKPHRSNPETDDCLTVRQKIGYTIPKGWIVFASSGAVHLNRDHFKDARTFNPWRWQADSRTENSINLFNPFGGGQRYCPGAELARVTLSVFLHHLVTQFRYTASRRLYH
ncbi:hypothetical protein RHMOL_Rhmol03G0164500 [Rhododendron molle]|uniref:Uncharacterized protein n=1 Tax=Rhododendron molle TaxID=49168 RepID=A0ACC0PFJ8_RHOML|nr:hypothetical protein RHMOL_Rhmol03G0164500 [Rhododendron molle]